MTGAGTTRGGGGRIVEARCTVEIEKTPASFHAYAVPEGVEIAPGDVVLVHEPPTEIAFNARITRECRITVRRANAVQRWLARMGGMFALTELYEVGFEAKETA